MNKNIVIFADGTGQEGGVGNNTNVYELFNLIEDRTQRQISYYDRGLGTGWRRISGSIGGAGITKNILESYEFLSNCFNAGDQIYLFGFSRGATTVRTLAAFIHRFGILPRSRPELIKRAYRIYKTRNKDRRRKREKEFLQQNHTMWTRIRFLGVWDTVAALGLPSRLLNPAFDLLPFFHNSFHDLRLSKSVEFARHALAIDDERNAFHPKLWDERDDKDDRRDQKYGIPDFSASDITDVYLVAAKLKAAADPLSRRLTAVTFSEADSIDLSVLLPKLRNPGDDVSTYVMGKFSPKAKKVLNDKNATRGQRLDAVIDGLNHILLGDSIYDEQRFAGRNLRETTRELALHHPKDAQLVYLNRLLLEDAYPAEIPRVDENGLLSGRTRQLLDGFGGHLPGVRRSTSDQRRNEQQEVDELKTALARDFNEIVKGTTLYNAKQAAIFDGMDLSRETKDLIEENPSSRRLNRLLLEDNYCLTPADCPRVKQVWFAGMHTDVGGGYPSNELAHVPLVWMLKEAIDVGLQVYPKHKVNLRPNARGKMHDSRDNLWKRCIFRRRVRTYDPNKNQGKLPIVHESVLIRHRSELDYEPWLLKRKYDVEHWPERLMSSVQFDDYYVWREGVWGFDSAFAVPWSAIERVAYDETERTITLHLRSRGDSVRRDKDAIVIRGSLLKGIAKLSSAFENYKLGASDAELRKRDEQQQDWLNELHQRDREHTEQIQSLREELTNVKGPFKSAERDEPGSEGQSVEPQSKRPR